MLGTVETVTGIAAIIMGLVLLVFVVPRRRRLLRLQREQEADRQREQRRQMKDASESWLVDMTELGRDITARLDNKISVLKTLLEEADQSIQELKKLQSQKTEIAGNDSPDKTDEAATNPFHEKVYALADEGQDAAAIALELNRPRGEIDLILGLRSREPNSL